MADKIDFFWEVFKAVAGETTDPDVITTALNSLAKSDRTKVDNYFTNVIDQSCFSTTDYFRLRKLFVNLFATHRTLISQSIQSSDPHSLTNSDLDELFRSFGFPYSAQLKGLDSNPLEQKVQFFLDLVNLYKVKGTPQSLVDVLQYYGVTDVDIYEFLLKFSTSGDLIFKGNFIAGTSIIPKNNMVFPFANITEGDPHWLYTEQQILNLNTSNKIRLPSQTPYIGVQPIVQLDGGEITAISRTLQDQYAEWYNTGTLPEANAQISEVGETVSFLELYLSTIYTFNKLYDVGSTQGDRFMCYDGTSTNMTDVLNEYDELSSLPIDRCDLNSNEYILSPLSSLYLPSTYCADSKLQQFYDNFTRPNSENFLTDRTSAEHYLQIMNSGLKDSLDSIGDQQALLFSLLSDMAEWVRNNIGFGFVNFGFILFGVNQFFTELKPVIDFFKPYRARLLFLESLQIRNRLLNTIRIEDKAYVDVTQHIYDFLTGDSVPCCVPTDTTCADVITKCSIVVNSTYDSLTKTWKGIWYPGEIYNVNDLIQTGSSPGATFICTVAHISQTDTKPGSGSAWTSVWDDYSHLVCTEEPDGFASYSRDYFDCGSYFDIGAVTDIRKDPDIIIEDVYSDTLCCIDSSATYVHTEVSNFTYSAAYSAPVPTGQDYITVAFLGIFPSTDYVVGVTLRAPTDTSPIYSYAIVGKTQSTFTLQFSGIIENEGYYLDWYATDIADTMGMTPIPLGVDTLTVPFTVPEIDTNYTIVSTLVNTGDSTPSIFPYYIINDSTTSFTVVFTGAIDSANYTFEWYLVRNETTPSITYAGYETFSDGTDTLSITLPVTLSDNEFPLLVNMMADSTDAYIFIPLVIEKTINSFKVVLSGDIDTQAIYKLAWAIPSTEEAVVSNFTYYQAGGFMDFDDGGTFDCTFAFDLAHIFIEEAVPQVTAYLLQQDGSFILQEDGSRLEFTY